ncbi:UBX domain-containing protein 11 isoform X2 [Hippoglossus stenolepis]|uniref:UBX domain-containing protein 11 isoform X2 n=1 Tax=Hippoglossus stenolepis TaxID=195615 RepID=UPI001FAF4ACF|nr:UBX domain-containing protein 11 isoform X2 [Hippoglossus stenolepis]
MSSPLTMLKKMKRAPLQGHSEQWSRGKLPFRRNLLKEIQSELVDDDDDSSDPDPPKPCHNPAATKPKAPLKKGAPPSDLELMSAMMQRVTLLEKQVRGQAQELEHKDKKISVLEEKLRDQNESERGRDPAERGRDDLERRCQELQNQVHEMESFLKDYGLTWVGDGESSDSAECTQTHSSGTSGVRDFHMNFNLVLQRIKELNILAGEGESYVRSTATGAQLARKDPVHLRLYSNGIVMFDGPFRSYQEHSTQQCMQDLMDGYFPSELQDRFPDGVPFQLHDRRDEEFIFRPAWDQFPGNGRAVYGEKDDASNVASFKTQGLFLENITVILPPQKKIKPEIPPFILMFFSFFWFSGRKLTTDQFLSRMPKVVVKAGRVIDIRESLRATLQGSSAAQSSDSAILIDTAALQAMEQRLQASSSDRPSSAHDIITLKVKAEDGDHTYVLTMGFSETIGHLRQYLDKHRGGGLPGYDIISAYPQCCYEDNSRTLQSCGLTTNATLLLRRRQHPQPLTAVKQIHL